MTDIQVPARTARWRRILGTALVALGALLAPVAILSTWAVTQVSDTDRFVATFAPLGADEDVQALVAGAVTEAVESNVDFRALVTPIVESLTAGLGATGQAAGEAAIGLAEQGARQLVAGAVTRVVESDAFSGIWEQALRASHTVVVEALTNDTIVDVSSDGVIGVQLGPIVERVKESLVDQGLAFVASIPEVDRVVPIGTSEAFAQARTAYGIALAVGFWLPWLVVVLIVGGLLLVGGGIRSLVFSAGGVALGMVLLLIGIAIGRAVALREFAALGLPDAVGALVFDQTVGGIVTAAAWILGFVLFVAAITWLFGPFDVVGRVRRVLPQRSAA